MRSPSNTVWCVQWAFSAAAACVAVAALAQQPASQQAAPQTAAQPANVIRLEGNATSAQLAPMPATQLVEFPNGLRLSAADVRSLAPIADRLRRSSASRSGVLRQPLTGPVVAIKPGTTMNEVINAPDNALLQMPDGRKVSVAQFKSVQGQLRTSAVTTGTRAQRNGPAVRVERGTRLAELLKRPDTDILESPGGKRITVGELRRFTQHDAARGKR